MGILIQPKRYQLKNNTTANLIKKERIIDPKNKQILVEGRPIKLDFGNYSSSAEQILNLLAKDKVLWDDNLVIPSYEEAIMGVDKALELAKTANYYDNGLLENMVAISLCGAHCQTCPPNDPPYSMLSKNELVYKMYGVLLVSAAIRNATNEFVKSIK